MVFEGPNLFARLHKWAARQDENFLTESLAVVLEQLLVLAPEVGTRIIRHLTSGFIAVPHEDASSIEIRTQVEAVQGRPDLEIGTPHRLVWIEVKAESELRTGQLEGYRVLLGRTGVKLTQLVLLTRYPQTYSTEDARPDLEVRWFEVADWLEQEMPATETAGEVASFLARQFLDFLRRRGMTLTQVGKYMPEGLRALGSLLNMLCEAAQACNVPPGRIMADRECIYLYLDESKYSISVEFADPEKLWFNSWHRIDPAAAAKLGVGECVKVKKVDGWSHGVALDSEEVHFYSRTKVGQMQWLESFLRDCLAKARSIETPEQSPPPEEPEGN